MSRKLIKHKDNVFCRNPNFQDPLVAIKDLKAKLLAQSIIETVNDKCNRVKIFNPIIPITIEHSTTSKNFSRLPVDERLNKSNDLFKRLNQALDSGRIAAIGYNAYDLLEKDVSAVALHSDHSSVVVARKRINGTCMYLVRNAWGKSCTGYQKEHTVNCINGEIWIDPADIKNSFYSITTINK